MTQPCPACSQPVQPAISGYPGGLTIPWHLDPAAPGKPCPASQGPVKAWEGQAPTIAQEPAQAPPKSRRVWLKAASPDENILLWLDLVEKQTGKPFILEGDAFCVMEEVGEFVEARSLAEAEDALCDTYVATLVSEELVKRGGFGGIAAEILPGSDSKACLEILATFCGRLAEFCRKQKTDARAKACADSSLTAKLAIKRELARLGLSFEESIEKVLDVLDKRLQDGYQMNAHGSAIKKSDQPSA